jgi:hypothetical protein
MKALLLATAAFAALVMVAPIGKAHADPLTPQLRAFYACLDENKSHWTGVQWSPIFHKWGRVPYGRQENLDFVADLKECRAQFAAASAPAPSHGGEVKVIVAPQPAHGGEVKVIVSPTNAAGLY